MKEIDTQFDGTTIRIFERGVDKQDIVLAISTIDGNTYSYLSLAQAQKVIEALQEQIKTH